MITRINYPQKQDWQSLTVRPCLSYLDINPVVEHIMNQVRTLEDKALLKYAKEFDGIELSSLSLSPSDWNTANNISDELKAAIQQAVSNIRTYHAAAISGDASIETIPGIRCWQRTVPVSKVGLYIPGGTAPLFSTLLMLAIPAQLACCGEIIVCSPPDKDGNIHPAVLYAAQYLGLDKVFKAGGAQAIAAMAYGTATIPRVDKIFGPGNQYVTAAKLQLASSGFAIDMPAGPSELAILADETCVPAYVAADLLSQAEHGPDSQVLLVSNSEQVIDAVDACVSEQLAQLPRKEIAEKALANSKAVLVSSLVEGLEFINEYAPEHLILACKANENLAQQVVNAGSVFLGNYAPESGGDYATGTNHTLPTNGTAKAFSGISVASFQKKISFQQLTKAGLESISNTVTQMARAEGLEAHARAIDIRFNLNS